MGHRDLIREIVGTYQKHGWELRRVLLRPETQAELLAESALPSLPLDSAPVEAAAVDGLWFARPSHEEREAWELRLLAENPFALFETFEKDETEEQREEMRREMEARLREYVGGQ
jgi:alpha-acetolactate decarboxylase